MENDLISKKELLELTGISYGQLYRWKRKKLIPEEWFIKKSSFTGQETFFPKKKILLRIEKIKSLKEDLPLDKLAEKLISNPIDLNITKDELIRRNIVTRQSIKIFNDIIGETNEFNFKNILFVKILDKLLSSALVSLEEAKLSINTLKENYNKLQNVNFHMLIIRKLGITNCILVSNLHTVYLDSASNLVCKIGIHEIISELKEYNMESDKK
jgi:DNA-binding transcriptional MerR regulator